MEKEKEKAEAKTKTKKKIAGRLFIFSTPTILLYIFLLSISTSLPSISAEISIVAHPTVLQLSPDQLVENSPGSKSGTLVVCERICIQGLSRFLCLDKYFHSLKVKVNMTQTSSRAYARNVEICFHRNASLGLGMCPQSEWEKVGKGLWVQSMSPYGNRLLDIRMPGPSIGLVKVSTEEEFGLHRVGFLVLGIVLMILAPAMSDSVKLYYGSAIIAGIILVILVVLFQGMKLLPMGRKSSLTIFIYSSMVGVGSFLLHHLSGMLHSVLVHMRMSEDLCISVGILLLACLFLAGAWLGVWSVRKLILAEDGTVDINVAHSVSWSIWIVAAVMIFLSSKDAVLATEVLVSVIFFLSVMRKVVKSGFLHHKFKYLFRIAKNISTESFIPNPDYDDSHEEYLRRIRRSKTQFCRSQTRPFSLAACNSPVQGSTRTPEQPSDNYYSTFHKTPERKQLSKKEWETFTKDSTRKALEGLISSPDFTKWAVANAERITLTPTDDSSVRPQRRRWLCWF